MARRISTGRKALNFGKSVAFGIGSALGSEMPGITSLASNNKEFMENIMDTMKDIRRGQMSLSKMLSKAGMSDELQDIYKEGGRNVGKAWDNFKKTGELGMSAKDREDAEKKAFGFDDDDFGTDLDLDDGDDDLLNDLKADLTDEIATPLEKSTAKIGAAQVNALNANTKATIAVGQKTNLALANVSSVIGKQTAVIFDGLNKSNKIQADIAKMNAGLNAAFYERSMAGMNTINQNLNNIISFNNDTLKNHVENASKYYSDSLTELQKISSILERAFPERNTKSLSETDFETAGMSGYNSSMSLSGYLEVVKKNLMNTQAGMILEMFTEPDTIKAIMADPVKIATELIFSSIIPKAASVLMKQVDQSFSNFIPALFGRIAEYGEQHWDSPLGTLAEIFGIKRPGASPNIRNYEKGAVPFDGITHRTINLVIPRYLSEIVSLLGGRKGLVYDYNEAKFTDENAMRKSILQDKTYIAKDAIGYDAMEYISETGKKFHRGTSKENEIFDKQLETIALNLAKMNKSFTGVDLKTIQKAAKNAGLENQEYAIAALATMLQEADPWVKNAIHSAGIKNATGLRELYNRRSEGDYRFDILGDSMHTLDTNLTKSLSSKDEARLRHLQNKQRSSSSGLTRSEKFELWKLKKEYDSKQAAEFGIREDDIVEQTNYGSSFIDRMMKDGFDPMIDRMDDLLGHITNIDNVLVDHYNNFSFGGGGRRGRRKSSNKYSAYENKTAPLTSGGTSTSVEELPANDTPEKRERGAYYEDVGMDFDKDEFLDVNVMRMRESFRTKRKEDAQEAEELRAETIAEEREREGFWDSFWRTVQSPFHIMAKGLEGMDRVLYNTFFGEQNGGNESFMQMISNNLKDTFHQIVKTLNEEFLSPLKQILYKDIIRGGMKYFSTNTANVISDFFNEDYGSDEKVEKNAFGRLPRYAFGKAGLSARSSFSRANGAIYRKFNKGGVALDMSGKPMIVSAGEIEDSFGGINPGTTNLNVLRQHAEGESAVQSALERIAGNGDIAKYASGNRSEKDILQNIEENTGKTADATELSAGIEKKQQDELDKAKTSGKTNSIKGVLGAIFGDIKTQLSKYIFGDNTDEKGNQKPVKDQIIDMLATGTRNFSRLFFGKDTKVDSESLEQYRKSFKQSIPQGVARGIMIGGGLGLASMATYGGAAAHGFGLLGSMFLPGGIVGSAVLGLGLGMLSTNRNFMNMIFGEGMYDENGKLTGRADNGLISQRVQRFVKENKTTLLGGAALGLAQGIFLNQSLFSSALGLIPGLGAGTGLVGGLAAGVFGPVTISMGAGLLLRNEKVQKMIFGEIDGTTGEREGGLISKKSQQFMKRAFPNIFAGGALGAGGALMASTVFGSGILGGLLTPYAGAVIGAATGFGLASEKFRTALFGEQNEKGEFISGGAVDRAKNFFQAEVFNPIANFFDIEFTKTKGWFKKDVIAPILDAVEPAKIFIGSIYDTAKEFLTGTFKGLAGKIASIFEPILRPITDFAKYAARKMRDAFAGVLHGILSLGRTLIGTAVSITTAPFKALGFYYSFKEKYAERMEAANQRKKERYDEINNDIDTDMGALDERVKERNANSEMLRARRYKATDSQLAIKNASLNTVLKELSEGNDEVADNTAQIAENTGVMAAVMTGGKRVTAVIGRRFKAGVIGKQTPLNASVIEKAFGVNNGENEVPEGVVTDTSDRKNDRSITWKGMREAYKEGKFRGVLLDTLGKIGANAKDASSSLLNKIVDIGKAVFRFLPFLLPVAASVGSALLVIKNLYNWFTGKKDPNETEGGYHEDRLTEQYAHLGINTGIKYGDRALRNITGEGLDHHVGRLGTGVLNYGKTKYNALGYGGKDSTNLAFERFSRAHEKEKSLIESINMRRTRLDQNNGSFFQDLSDKIHLKMDERKLSNVVAEERAAQHIQQRAIANSKGALTSGSFKDIAKDSSRTLIERFTDMCKKAIEMLGDSKIIKDYLGPGVGKLTKSLSSLLPKIKSSGKLGTKVLGKIGWAMAKATGSTALTATGVGAVVTGAFAVYDATRGAVDANTILGVDEEDVTPGMRTACALYNAITGFSYFILFDLLLELAYNLSEGSLDAKRIFVGMIYKALPGTDDVDITALQQKHDAAYEKYLETNVGATKEQFEQYQKDLEPTWLGTQARKTQLGRYLFGYNDENGKYINGVFADVHDSVGKFMENVSDYFGGVKKEYDEYAEEHGVIGGAFKFLGSFLSDTLGLSGIFDPIKKLVTTMTDMTSKAIDKITNFMSNLATKFTEGAAKIRDMKVSDMASTAWDFLKNAGSEAINRYLTNPNDKGGKGYGTAGGAGTGSSITPEVGEYHGFYQNDPMWGNNRLPGQDGTMSQIGCAPTAMANALTSATGSIVTPKDTLSFAGSEYAPTDGSQGITSNYIPDVAARFGANAIPIDPNDENSIRKATQAGLTLIAGGKSTDNSKSNVFTTQGHYVTLKGGMEKNGRYMVKAMDPLGPGRNKYVDLRTLSNDINRGGPSSLYAITGSRSSLPRGVKASSLPYNLLFTGMGRNDWEPQTSSVSWDGARNETMNALDDLAGWYKQQTGDNLIVTAVTNGEHAGGKYSHANGWKVDVNDWGGSRGYTGEHLVTNNDTPGSLAAAFEKYGIQKGLGMNWENDHFDISAAGEQWATPLNSEFAVGSNGGYGDAHPNMSLNGNGNNKSSGILDIFSDLGSKLSTIAKDYVMSLLSGRPYTGTIFDTSNGRSGVDYSNLTPADLTGENVQDTWNYLSKVGFNEAERAGIMGNLSVESGIDPTKVEGGGHANEITVNGPGYGIAQWTYPTRQQGLLDYARMKGSSSGNLGTQLEYLWAEAQNSGAIERMHAASDKSPENMADIWCTDFEAPDEAVAHRDRRRGDARAFYDYLKGSGGSGLGMNRPSLMQINDLRRRISSTKSGGSGIGYRPNYIFGRSGGSGSSIDNFVERSNAATTNDLINSIRSLDNHAELRAMCELLRVIAKNQGITVSHIGTAMSNNTTSGGSGKGTGIDDGSSVNVPSGPIGNGPAANQKRGIGGGNDYSAIHEKNMAIARGGDFAA